MSYSFSTTFTRTHAREIASRVAADLRLMQVFYDKPADADIDAYEEEFVELLALGYLRSVEYGFKRNGDRVVSLLYTVRPGIGEPDRAGRVYATAEIDGAVFFSFLDYTREFYDLSPSEQGAVTAKLPLDRTPGSAPGSGNGYWVRDRAYGAAGVLASRQTFRPL